MITTLLLLSGCRKEVVEETIAEPQYPAGAIFPVMADEEKGIKSTEIALTDFSFTIPEGYVYGKVENEGYNAYYVWQDKEDKEYSLELDGDIMLYIYDGIDSNSPHEELSDIQARSSFVSTYFGYLRNAINGRFNTDANVTSTVDDKYYVCCFDGNSGDSISTTYSVMCYPKTYYGIYALQKETDTYDRRFYGFVFSNDNEGEIFKESEYTALLNEIKSSFKITEFYTIGQSPTNYDPKKDISAGRNYEQMLELFENTYLYYVETIGKPWERENVDPETGKMIDFDNADFTIRFIDVGQADAALVQCDGEYMLIDGGNSVDGDAICNILQEEGVEHLKMIVATHAHSDHVGGLSGVLNYMGTDLTLCPVTDYDNQVFKDFASYADENGGGIVVPSVGDTYALGSSTITVLGVNSGNDTNDTSIVLMIEYGKTSFLFAGDAERETEQVLLDSGADLSANVLKVGRHGADTSTSREFLQEIMPEHAVISVEKDSPLGLPAEVVLNLLDEFNVNVWRTDLSGDIYCASDGNKVQISLEETDGEDIEENMSTNDVLPVNEGEHLQTSETSETSETESVKEP